jgi:hypothetical protein
MDRLADRIADKVSERRTADTVELAQSLRRIEDEVGKLKEGLAGTNATVGSMGRDLSTLQMAVGATALKAEKAVGAATEQVKGVSLDIGVAVAESLTEKNFLIPKEYFTWRNFWSNFLKRWKSLSVIAGLFWGAWRFLIPLLNNGMTALAAMAKHAIMRIIGHPWD